MTTSVIRAGGTGVAGVQTTGGDDGALSLKVGPLDTTVEALSITSAGAATLASTLAVTGDLTANNFAGRNKFIGGDFTTNPWQRGTSFAAIANLAYFADRWKIGWTSSARMTASKAADAPTAAQAGTFTQHCISLAVTTADTSIAAADLCVLTHVIEGLNAASFGFGQAGSRNVTLSFWVKGTKTGIHCVSIWNSAGSRSYVAEYTIDSTNTWEYKTITIPVETTGTWLYTNGIGLRLDFSLMTGTNWHTSADTWAAGAYFSTSNQVNAVDSTSNTFKIALVQLEAGSVATTFDARSVGTELALCQRYYYQTVYGGSDTTIAHGTAASATVAAQCGSTHPVTMRAIPTLAEAGTLTAYDGTANGDIGISVNSCSITNLSFNCTASSLTEGRAVQILANAAADYLTLTAEL